LAVAAELLATVEAFGGGGEDFHNRGGVQDNVLVSIVVFREV
jgi:hypothetical protein